MPLFRVVGEKDVHALLDEQAALAIARATFRDQAIGHSRLSTPSAMTLDANREGGPRFKFKAATVGHLNASGIRLLARRGGNTGFDACNYTAVYDHDGGVLSGLVSELWLSRVRTAAFAVAAIEPLVRSGPLTIGLFGSGDIATEMVPLLAASLPIAAIRVHSRRTERARAFADKFAGSLHLPVTAEQNPEAVVEGADLVITVTESPTPLVQPGWLAPGAVLCSMGSYNEVAFGVLGEINRVIVDDPDYATEMGDGAAWIAQGHLTSEGFRKRIDALAADVISGQTRGRMTADDRILALVQGMAVGDIAFAVHVLRAAETAGCGQVLDLA
jgi:alanine dehydrogenase